MFGAYNVYSPVTSPAQSRRSSVVPGSANTPHAQSTSPSHTQPHQSNTLSALEAAANFLFGDPTPSTAKPLTPSSASRMGGGPVDKPRPGASSVAPANAVAGPSGSRRPSVTSALASAPITDDWSSRSSSEGVVEIMKGVSSSTPLVADPATSSAAVWAGNAGPSGSGSGPSSIKIVDEFSPSPSLSASSILHNPSDASSGKGKQSAKSPSSPKDGQVRLLFSKSHVYVHPTQSSKDNIPGWLGLAEVPSGSSIEFDLDREVEGQDEEVVGGDRAKGKAKAKKEVILFWIPSILAENLEEKERYETVEERRPVAAVSDGKTASDNPEEEDEDDYVFVTLPTKPSASTKDLPPSRRGSFSKSNPPSRKSTLSEDLAASFLHNPDAALNKAKAYAFSLPISQLYSLLVYPPSLRNWYGCVTINLLGGVSLPGLWFHDDESGSTLDLMTGRQAASAATGGKSASTPSRTGAPWGFTPFHASLLSHCELLKSSLVPNLYLINPTRMDREVHEIDLGEEANQRVLPRAGGPVRTAAAPGVNAAAGSSTGSISKFGTPSTNSAGAQIKSSTGTNSPTKAGQAFAPYPPKPTFPSAFDSPLASAIHPARTQLLSSFSKFTQSAKKLTEQALSQPLFEPFVPLMPEPVRSLVTVPGEWESKGKKFAASLDAANGVTTPVASGSGSAGAGGKGKSSASVREVAGEYESARVYLARWARVVAEEGERARQAEIARNASLSGASTPMHPKDSASNKVIKSELGVFELVKSLRGGEVPPATTRTPGNPVTEADFQEWQQKGLAESYLRAEVFRRGISEEGEARRMIWEVLLGVIAWEVGLQDDKEVATKKRAERRNEQRREYERLRGKWQHPAVHPDASEDDADSIHESEEQRREEWHRIDLSLIMRDIPRFLHSPYPTAPATNAPIAPSPLFSLRQQVDCRRTDRTQAMFMVPEESRGDEEKEGGGASAEIPNADLGEAEEGSQTALNPHTATLRLILMTYHQYSPQLGYVQGMSDLLSPIYVVFQADEAISFWAFVGWMRLMENNFLRDQSGMKAKLSTLQQLIEVMDPQLYRKLVRTDSLNLFFCFRWILIAFKREFKFDDVIRLWDVLFTSYYSDEFVLFIALAILHSHREVIIRYLIEFDEVLKYANDLGGTIDLQSTLAQAEVLFLSFRSLVEQVDRNEAIRIGTLANAAQADEDDSEMRQRSGAAGGAGTRGRRGSISGLFSMGGTPGSTAMETTRSLSVHGRGEAGGSGGSNGGGMRSRRGSDASVKTARSVADDIREREHRELVSDDLRGLLIGFKDL